MSLPIHTIDKIRGSSFSQNDRVKLGVFYGTANVVGSAAGAAVVTAVAMPAGEALPANYFVEVEVSQDATYFVSGKTSSGFNVTMNPRIATNTLAAGSFNFKITA